MTVAVLARGVSLREYGAYATLVAAISLINAFVGTGLGTAVLGDVAGRRALGGRPRVILSATAVCSALLVSVLPAVIVAAVISSDPLVVAFAGSAAVAFVASEVAQGAMLGGRRFSRYLAATSARAVVGLVGVLLVLVLPGRLRLAAAFAALTLSAVAFVIASRAHWGIGRSPSRTSSVSQIGAINLMLWILASGDRLILASSAGVAAVASYAAAYGVLDRALRAVLNGYVARHFASAFRETGDARSRRHIFYYVGAVAGLVLALGVGTPFLVETISGDRLRPSVNLTLPIACGIGMLAATAPIYTTLIAAGRYRPLLMGAALATVVSLVGNAVLDPRFGAEAASLLTFAAYAIYAGFAVFALTAWRDSPPWRSATDSAARPALTS